MQPISAGVVSALVAFTSTFAVVLAGLSAVGADPAQAASGLMVVTVLMGLGSILLAVWSRQPITIAWSTPGAALLASTGAVEGGWPAAVGAFLVVGLLVVATGLIPALGDLIARIPPAVAQAMLAGVLLDLSMTASLSSSLNVGQKVLSNMSSITPLHKRRVEQAGFMVLKSPDIP